MVSKHLYVMEKLGLIGSTSFGFAQNTLHDFRNIILNYSGIAFDKFHKKNYNLN